MIRQDSKDETLLVHTPIDWTDVLREAEKLGAAHNLAIGCRSADLFHVAACRRLGSDTGPIPFSPLTTNSLRWPKLRD
jgi:hypothetical protein